MVIRQNLSWWSGDKGIISTIYSFPFVLFVSDRLSKELWFINFINCKPFIQFHIGRFTIKSTHMLYVRDVKMSACINCDQFSLLFLSLKKQWMAYMSSFQMKSPPSDGEILDDWEQMADSGVSWIFQSYYF